MHKDDNHLVTDTNIPWDGLFFSEGNILKDDYHQVTDANISWDRLLYIGGNFPPCTKVSMMATNMFQIPAYVVMDCSHQEGIITRMTTIL